jgi:hypothetical protein
MAATPSMRRTGMILCSVKAGDDDIFGGAFDDTIDGGTGRRHAGRQHRVGFPDHRRSRR